MTPPAPNTPHRIAVLALDEVYAFELGIPGRIFDSAAADDGPLYEVRVCTLDGRGVRTSAGFTLQPDHDAGALEWADTVIVPAPQRSPAVSEGVLAPAAGELLRAAAERGARLVSICTGAFVLAAAGLLDGRPATTHWAFTEHFHRLFPGVRLEPNVLFVDDGEILTSAGAAAGIDLCLHLVRRDHGSEAANRAARGCVVPPWREGGQAQFIERPVPVAADTTTAPAREWALAHLGEPMGLAVLADRAGMSKRTFTRRFRAETGLSPTVWLLQRRLEHARHLLETTSLPVDRVARDAGFGTDRSLRLQLHKALGVSPAAYRRTFRGRD
ncbi:GlxA family transcriptional regulator [Actinomadura gamaensis]|uniref:GlxA family transcriptional regulator n=1 Tax=Actinomadura gamaensis TaxID=1763541 RepID=A0ABV9TXM3_9ACTN